MKNLFLTIILVAGIAVTVNVNAANLSENRTVVKTERDVNTFCKLIQKGNYEAVKSMIEIGIDVNKKSVGMTPLMYAARYNRTKILVLLIKNGANLKIVSNRGYSALKYAEMSKAHDTYKILSEELKIRRKRTTL